jgi:hypothetical protein
VAGHNGTFSEIYRWNAQITNNICDENQYLFGTNLFGSGARREVKYITYQWHCGIIIYKVGEQIGSRKWMTKETLPVHYY